MKKAGLSRAVAAGFAVASAFQACAVHAGEAAGPHTLTSNVGLHSQYVFRGLTQTNEEPALQGGFDYGQSGGFYAGTWGSNISWLRDSGAYADGGNLELDIYAGFRGAFGDSALSYDVGLLYYWYPGNAAPGLVEANTTELYVGLGWKWITARLSCSLGNDTFGVAGSGGTFYADLTANIPFGGGLAGVLHYGMQEFDGTVNRIVASYRDWKVGVTYALPRRLTLGAFLTGTDMNLAQKSFYTTPGGTVLGNDQFVISISRAL